MSFPQLPFGCLKSRRGLPSIFARLESSAKAERDKSMFARLISRNSSTVLPSFIRRLEADVIAKRDKTMFARLIAKGYAVVQSISEIAGKYIAYWDFESFTNNSLLLPDGVNQWNDSTPNNNNLDTGGDSFAVNTVAGLVGNGTKSIGGAFNPLAPIPLTSYPYFVFTGWFKLDGVFTPEDADETSGRQFTPELYRFNLFEATVPNGSISLNVLAIPGGGGSPFEPPNGARNNAIRVTYTYGESASIDIRFTNGWVFVYAEADINNKILILEVNNSNQSINGFPDYISASFNSTVADISSIDVGGYNGQQGDDFVVLIDEIGFASDRLTPTERSQIYNNGAGRTYPFT